MKRVIVSVILTTFSIAFSLFSGSFIEEKLHTLEEELSICYEFLTEEDLISAEKKADDIYIYWSKNKRAIKLLISGEDCQSLEEEIKNLGFFIRSENRDSSLESISNSRNIILTMKENEKLSFDSVL